MRSAAFAPLPPPVVVALGGNAISRVGEEGNVPQQFANSAQTARFLADLVAAGRTLVVTHGNGPQVGNVLRRVELASKELYRLPLEICGAHTQGGMGYMIAQCLNNELARRGLTQRATAVVTSVEVDEGDSSFRQPTKPIGGFYPPERAEQLRAEHGWQMVHVPPHGFRRVVPSPAPRAIVEIDFIRRLVQGGELLVVAGGGGIPVVRDADGWHGVEAVIDKDRTAALLAAEIGSDTLIIATAVERVALHYGTPAQRFLDRISVADAERYLAERHFPAGSMGPKIEAAISFLRNAPAAQASVVICGLNQIADALAGRAGTQIGR